MTTVIFLKDNWNKKIYMIADTNVDDEIKQFTSGTSKIFEKTINCGEEICGIDGENSYMSSTKILCARSGDVRYSKLFEHQFKINLNSKINDINIEEMWLKNIIPQWYKYIEDSCLNHDLKPDFCRFLIYYNNKLYEVSDYLSVCEINLSETSFYAMGSGANIAIGLLEGYKDHLDNLFYKNVDIIPTLEEIMGIVSKWDIYTNGCEIKSYSCDEYVNERL